LRFLGGNGLGPSQVSSQVGPSLLLSVAHAGCSYCPSPGSCVASATLEVEASDVRGDRRNASLSVTLTNAQSDT
jgi:hypothetical protein